MAELDVLAWQLHGVTVEETEKLEDSQHLAEFQRSNFGSRSHKLYPFVSCHCTAPVCVTLLHFKHIVPACSFRPSSVRIYRSAVIQTNYLLSM